MTFSLRKGFGSKPHTKRGHNKRSAQRRNEAARLRAMTPLLPPQTGNRRAEFSSPSFGIWLPADADRGVQRLAA